jgi:hypothetical protein
VHALLIGIAGLSAGMVTPGLRPLRIIVTADGDAPAAVSLDFVAIMDNLRLDNRPRSEHSDLDDTAI